MEGIYSFFNQFNLVRQLPVFSTLNWIELHKIARKSFVVEYRKGDIIRQEGDAADFFYCVVSGRIRAYAMSDDGRKENMDFLHRGMYFGIISALTGKTHSMTFEAINDSVMLQIPKDDFQQILKAVPILGVEFSAALSRRMRRRVKGHVASFESRIVSVYSPVRKTGSSTYARALAEHIQRETNKNVIYVNIDSLGNLNRVVSVDRVDFRKVGDDYSKVSQLIRKNDKGLHVLNLFFTTDDQTSLRKQIAPFVSNLADDYNYVIVDLPSEMDDLVLETLTQSDLVHLVSVERKDDLDHTHSVIDRLEIVLKDNFRADKIKIIIRTAIDDEMTYSEITKRLDFDVYAMLPHLDEQDKKEAEQPGIEGELSPAYQMTVRRIARDVSGVLVGLALGGGAALGLSHIGILKELEKENIPIDMVSGSSMGALIGAFWAIGLKAEEIENIARQFEHRWTLVKLMDPVFPISGFIGGVFIRRWLKKHLGDRTFYSTRIPLKIIAYDLMHRQDIVIKSGLILDAVCQSIAIPGVVNPIRKGEQVIIDGGVLNPVPTDVLISEGIKKVIAVNVLKSPKQVCKGFDSTLNKLAEEQKVSFIKFPLKFIGIRISHFFRKIFHPTISDIMVLTLQASEYLLAEQSMRQADVAIHPDLADFEWYEIFRVKQLIACGEAAAKEHMGKIKQLISED
ncbi:MAG: cyclic nucleotide-binding domain-containing protein [Candidatus Omnitrophica bacterium]|nr:cyclic nucleotide-binding domain-containing protein [Candidatus Omnitrophota bacterium]